MNANTKTEQSALAVPPATEAGALALITLSPEKYAAEVYQPFEDQLAAAIEGVRTISYDITTTAGMATAVKCRASFRDPRTDANNERELRKAPIIKIGKLIDSKFASLKERAMPFEEMFDAEIKAEVARKAEVKAAEEKAKQDAIDAIYAKIDAIRYEPSLALGMSVEALKAVIDRVSAIEITTEEFSTLAPQAQVALEKTIEELKVMLVGAEVAEENKRAIEAARIAEAERLAAERVENARVAAENARIAAEQKAEAKRLADLAAEQQAAAAALQREADAKAAAERAAQAKAASELQAKFDQQAAEFAKQKAAIEAQQAAADARDAAAKAQMEREAAHPEALMMNAEFDVARDAARAAEVERARLQALAVQAVADGVSSRLPEMDVIGEEWSWSFDGERYQGQESTIVGAIQSAIAESSDQVSGHFYVGRNVTWVGEGDADTVIERLQEQCYEDCGEIGETYLEDVTKEEKQELANLITEWAARVDRSNFWTVTDVRQFGVVGAQEIVAAARAV